MAIGFLAMFSPFLLFIPASDEIGRIYTEIPSE